MPMCQKCRQPTRYVLCDRCYQRTLAQIRIEEAALIGGVFVDSGAIRNLERDRQWCAEREAMVANE